MCGETPTSRYLCARRADTGGRGPHEYGTWAALDNGGLRDESCWKRVVPAWAPARSVAADGTIDGCVDLRLPTAVHSFGAGGSGRRKASWTGGTGNVPHVADEGLPGFGERVLAVIDEGRRISTYKLAVLLALIDVCAERPDPDGNAPVELPTIVVSRRVAELYWPQVRSYQLGSERLLLKQITASGSAILATIAAVASQAGAKTSFVQAERRDAAAVGAMVKRVDEVVRNDPLPRLQRVNGADDPFVYDLIDGHRLRFRPGASDALVRLAPLIRPLVELHWVRAVARWNHIASDERALHQHLFGVQRTGFPGRLRAELSRMQAGDCFYCGRALSDVAPIDHFIPRKVTADGSLVRSCANSCSSTARSPRFPNGSCGMQGRRLPKT